MSSPFLRQLTSNDSTGLPRTCPVRLSTRTLGIWPEHRTMNRFSKIGSCSSFDLTIYGVMGLGFVRGMPQLWVVRWSRPAWKPLKLFFKKAPGVLTIVSWYEHNHIQIVVRQTIKPRCSSRIEFGFPTSLALPYEARHKRNGK